MNHKFCLIIIVIDLQLHLHLVENLEFLDSLRKDN